MKAAMSQMLVSSRIGKCAIAAAMAMSLASTLHAADGTWTADGDGNWTESGNWSGAIADGVGFTANFTAELTTATRTVTLNGDRTIGNITFTDTTSSHNLTLSGANTLTLDVTSGAPTINVTQSDRTLTIGSVVAGNEGLTKSGSGTLALSAANIYSGGTSLSSGTLQLGNATSMGSSTLTMASGTTLQLRNDSDTTFTAPVATPAGAVTYTFDVNNAGSAVTGKKLSLGNLTFATSTANQINITGGNSYTLGLGTLSHPSGSGGPWAFTVNPTTAAVTITKFSTGSYGTALVLQGGNVITLTTFEMGSNGANSLTVSGSGTVVTLGSTTAANNRSGGSAAYTLSSGTLNLTSTTSLANVYISGVALAPTFAINGGILNNTSGSALTLGALVGGTQNNKPTITLGGNFSFGTSGSTSANDLNLGTSAVPLGANRSITVNGTTTLTLDGIVSGAFTLTKNGTGTLTLRGVNTYSGITTVNSGTLAVTGGGQLYSTLNLEKSNALTVNSGGTIEFDNWTWGGSFGQLWYNKANIVINGGTLRYVGTTANGSNNRSFTIGANGATLESATSGQRWVVTSSGSYTTLVSNGGTLTLTGTGDGQIAQIIPIGGGVTMNGSGTWTLSGINTYTGKTTINAGTLSIGAETGLGGNPGSATADQLTLNGGTLQITATFSIDDGNRGVTLGASGGTFNVDPTFTLTVAKIIAGASLSKTGTGTLILSGDNTYSGGTTVSVGTLTMGHANALGSTSGPLTVNGGTMNMASFSLTVGNLTGTGGVISGTSGSRTLTIGQGDTGGGNYQGIIADGSGGTTALTKTGNGTITLSGANTYTGTTTINAGILALGANNTLDADNNVVLAGGALDIGAYTNALGALTVTDDSTIALGTGTGTLSFASVAGWTAGKRLALTGTLGGTKLKFESSLTPEQLACMSYIGQAVTQNASGYVIDAKRGTVYLIR